MDISVKVIFFYFSNLEELSDEPISKQMHLGFSGFQKYVVTAIVAKACIMSRISKISK